MLLRPFDSVDWDAFAGAERPANAEPQLNQVDVTLDGEEALVIVDAQGVQVLVTEPEDRAFTFNVNFNVGVLIAQSLPVRLVVADLTALGFRELDS